MEDPKDVVRRGYDVLSRRYDDVTGAETKYQDWIDRLIAQLAPGSRVLDVGCGSGVPVARALADGGHQVVGVDISEVQISRAREHVPNAEFVNADVMSLEFPPESFHAIVSLYALIHLPLDEQPELIGRIAGWLRPNGLFVCTTGHQAWTGTDDNWLDGGAAMWWSHTDAATYRSWLVDAGLTVDAETFVPEGSGGHTLFRAHRM
jgi:ubiquinone/menaquinone biosynthesis C-methylase UbiE